jgi:hypothetical protein
MNMGHLLWQFFFCLEIGTFLNLSETEVKLRPFWFLEEKIFATARKPISGWGSNRAPP